VKIEKIGFLSLVDRLTPHTFISFVDFQIFRKDMGGLNTHK